MSNGLRTVWYLPDSHGDSHFQSPQTSSIMSPRRSCSVVLLQGSKQTFMGRKCSCALNEGFLVTQRSMGRWPVGGTSHFQPSMPLLHHLCRMFHFWGLMGKHVHYEKRPLQIEVERGLKTTSGPCRWPSKQVSPTRIQIRKDRSRTCNPKVKKTTFWHPAGSRFEMDAAPIAGQAFHWRGASLRGAYLASMRGKAIGGGR